MIGRISIVVLLIPLVIQSAHGKVDEHQEKVETVKTSIPADHAAKSENHGEFDRKSYQKLLQVKRQQQAASVQSMLDIQDNKRVKEFAREAITNIRRVLSESKRIVDGAKFLAKSTAFPVEDPLRDSVAKIVENTAMFFELVVYLPDYADFFYHKLDMKELIDWCYEFATKMALYDDATYKLLTNGAQELEMIPRMPNYKNSYRKVHIREAQKQKAMDEYHKAEEAKKNKKESEKKSEHQKKTKPGPKLSKSEL
ncbi:AN1-type domain-containing protein [Aphelenchoides besseyi]|nr:AN1-type domain-containing protein [Aphelenchoides besseyi]KAI6211848.1 AN1-type domain-containing protein [Aphelenchoides besseyi]